MNEDYERAAREVGGYDFTELDDAYSACDSISKTIIYGGIAFLAIMAIIFWGVF
jgi:parvulin-like peptidyl-prolyl isomerase